MQKTLTISALSLGIIMTIPSAFALTATTALTSTTTADIQTTETIPVDAQAKIDAEDADPCRGRGQRDRVE